MLHNQVLVLKIRVFQQDTANEIKRLIEENSSSRLKAVLIDLRNNPAACYLLLLSQPIYFKSWHYCLYKKSFRRQPAISGFTGNDFQNIKVGILINHRSASAAEVLLLQ